MTPRLKEQEFNDAGFSKAKLFLRKRNFLDEGKIV